MSPPPQTKQDRILTDARLTAWWQLARAGAELAYLLAAAAANDVWVRPALAGTFVGNSAAIYAMALVACVTAGYCLLGVGLSTLYRKAAARRVSNVKAAGPRRAWMLIGRSDRRRIALTALTMPAILVPYALIPEPTLWLPVSATLAAVVLLLSCIERRKLTESAADLEIPNGRDGVSDKLDCLRALGEARGRTPPRIAVVSSHGPQPRPAAAALAVSGRPTVYLSHRALEVFSESELKAVFAHELAHCELGHTRKTQYAVLLSRLVSAWVVCLIIFLAAPPASSAQAAVRLMLPALLLWYLLRTFSLPVENAYLRRQELQAHRRALGITSDPSAHVAAMRKLTGEMMTHAGPGRLANWLLNDAPSLGQVVGIARRYAAEHGMRLPDADELQ